MTNSIPEITHFLAPATYAGIMPGFADIPAVELWTLTEDIPDHPKCSTVSRQTLEENGYHVPRLNNKQ